MFAGRQQEHSLIFNPCNRVISGAILQRQFRCEHQLTAFQFTLDQDARQQWHTQSGDRSLGDDGGRREVSQRDIAG
jgi:hypothetical protein